MTVQTNRYGALEGIRVEAYNTTHLLEVVGVDVFRTINEYQTSTPVHTLLDFGPLPEDAIPAGVLKLNLDIEQQLTHNNRRYTPEIETEIESDLVIQGLKSLRETHKKEINPKHYAIAYRTRRTVLAALAIDRARN